MCVDARIIPALLRLLATARNLNSNRLRESVPLVCGRYKERKAAMARLTLQLEDRVLKEYAVGTMATIGRLADNTIVIDSPAVSSHHASVVNDNGMLAVEDLQSTNGTFVNGVRVSRKTLKHGDVVQVGEHQLVLDQMAEADTKGSEDAGPSTGTDGATVFIDKRTLVAKLMQSEAEARKYEALLARLSDIETQASATPSAAPAAAEKKRTATLRVISGRADQAVYQLTAQTSLVGKAHSSLVRLRGWFKPQIALSISRNRQGYVATWLGGVVLVDSKPMNGRHELKNGDLIEVCGLLLEFSLEK